METTGMMQVTIRDLFSDSSLLAQALSEAVMDPTSVPEFAFDWIASEICWQFRDNAIYVPDTIVKDILTILQRQWPKVIMLSRMLVENNFGELPFEKLLVNKQFYENKTISNATPFQTGSEYDGDLSDEQTLGTGESFRNSIVDMQRKLNNLKNTYGFDKLVEELDPLFSRTFLC